MVKIKDILKSMTILYAEDDPITRESIAKSLSLLVKEVIVAEDGAQAIELFNSNRVNIVILDYIMPIADGSEVAAYIRQSDRDIPILIFSSYVDKEKLLSSIKTGVNNYLEKPIDFDQLYKALEEAVQILIKLNKLTAHLSDGVRYNYVEKTIESATYSQRLTKNKSSFLEILLSSPLSLVAKEIIENEIFKNGVEANALRTLVYRLRKKIPVDVIVSIKDLGYIFRPL